MGKTQSERRATCKLLQECRERFGPLYEKSDFIFRGESDYCNPNVSCSLLRKMRDVPGYRNEMPFDAEEVMRHLSIGAAPYVGGDVRGREFETIATMQHYGAMTPLIDFSGDWRIALYFASEREESKDGKVIYFTEKRAEEGYGLIVKRPQSHHHDQAGRLAGRQIDQESVLVWAERGEFNPLDKDVICIPSGIKPHILAWLRTQGLSEDVIYNDVHHYIDQLNDNPKASASLILASVLIEQCDWSRVISILKDALGLGESVCSPIVLIEERGKAFHKLAHACKEKGRWSEALDYYLKSAELLQSQDNGVSVRLDAEDCATAMGCPDIASGFREQLKVLW